MFLEEGLLVIQRRHLEQQSGRNYFKITTSGSPHLFVLYSDYSWKCVWICPFGAHPLPMVWFDQETLLTNAQAETQTPLWGGGDSSALTTPKDIGEAVTAYLSQPTDIVPPASLQTSMLRAKMQTICTTQRRWFQVSRPSMLEARCMRQGGPQRCHVSLEQDLVPVYEHVYLISGIHWMSSFRNYVGRNIDRARHLRCLTGWNVCWSHQAYYYVLRKGVQEYRDHPSKLMRFTAERQHNGIRVKRAWTCKCCRVELKRKPFSRRECAHFNKILQLSRHPFCPTNISWGPRHPVVEATHLSETTQL